MRRPESVENRRLARFEEAETPSAGRAAALRIYERRRESAAFLTAQILRLQCLEQEESLRKARVYACEPGYKKDCGSPEGLAVEQLGVLREGRGRVASDRSGRIVKTVKQRESKAQKQPSLLGRGSRRRHVISPGS